MQTTLKTQYTTDLHWLAFLLTGRRDQSIDLAVETVAEFHTAQPFFTAWMEAWSRRVVIAKALTGIREELAASVRRTEFRRFHGRALPPRDWRIESGHDEIRARSSPARHRLFPPGCPGAVGLRKRPGAGLRCHFGCESRLGEEGAHHRPAGTYAESCRCAGLDIQNRPSIRTSDGDPSMPETIVAAIHQTEKLGTLWCALMHDSPMWPIHGEYRCRELRPALPRALGRRNDGSNRSSGAAAFSGAIDVDVVPPAPHCRNADCHRSWSGCHRRRPSPLLPEFLAHSPPLISSTPKSTPIPI